MKKLGIPVLVLFISYCLSIDLFALGVVSASMPYPTEKYLNIDKTKGPYSNEVGATKWPVSWKASDPICAGFKLMDENAAPNQPVLLQPSDNTTDISINPSLQVSVSDTDPSDNIDVSFYGRSAGTTTAADFTLVLIPDAQNESQYYPEIFTAMTDWIVAQKSARNIVFVTTAGDMVNTASSTTQYDNADAAMDKLDPPGIPYSLGVGNHDQPTTNFNTYFGVSRFSDKPWYGSHYGTTNDNNYSFFNASGMEFILINLEYNPSGDILDWADALLKANPDRRGIVESHSMLNIDNSWSNMGIYTALKDNPNLFLMLCGHMSSTSDGAAYRSEAGDDGHTIHVMLADYQNYPNGGNGYMRILRFSPVEDKIYATTYSPYINASITSTANYDQMEMVYDMEDTGDSYTLIGTINDVTNGSSASSVWPGRAYNTEYEWYVTVSDGFDMITGPIWSFTTASIPPPSSFSVMGSGSYCQSSNGLPVSLTNSEVGVNYTLYKNSVAQTPQVPGTGSTIGFGNQTAGVYTVSGTNSGGTTIMQGSAIITEIPAPATPTVTLTQPACGSATGTITVTAPTGAGMTYSINGSAYTNTSGIFTSVATGTYNVTAKNAAGCISAATSVTLNANPAPATPTVTLSQPACGSATGTITVTAPTGAGMTYSINGSAYTNTSGIFTSVAVGTYNVTAKNAAGCISAATSVTLTANPAPAAPTVTLTQPACGSATGTITVTAPTGAGMTYSINGSAYTNTSGIFTSVAAGTYNVTAKNAAGCISPATSVTLNANPAPATPTVTLTQPACGSATGTITVTAPTGAGMTYSINGSTYTNTSGIFTSVAIGTYNVTAKNAAGCISPATSVTLNANPAPATPTVTLSQPACGSTTGTITVTAPTGAGMTYSINGSTYTNTSGIFTSVAIGTYNVTAKNAAGCTSPATSVTLNANPAPATPTVTLTQPACGSATGTITVTAPTGAGMTYSINGSTYTNTSGIFTSVAIGTYNVTAKNAAGCISPATSVTLNANPAPATPTVTLTQPACGSATGTITVTAPTGAGMTYSINGSTYTNTSGIFTSVATGTYNVTAKNAAGCLHLSSNKRYINCQSCSGNPDSHSYTAGMRIGNRNHNCHCSHWCRHDLQHQRIDLYQYIRHLYVSCHRYI